MSAIQHEAIAIVHAGLADVLDWLGETPIAPWTPRHAADWEVIEVQSLNPFEPIVRRDIYQVPN